LEAEGQVSTVDTSTGADGKKHPRSKKSKPTIGIEKIRGPEPKPGQTPAEFVSEMRRSLVQLKVHHGKQLQDLLEKAEREFKAIEVDVPDDLEGQVRAILDEHRDLCWDDAIQIVLDGAQLDHVRAKKQKAKKKSGDFTDVDEAEEDDK
jgi:hypothetical protein